MVFSSTVFIFSFLVVVLAVYYLLKPLPIIVRNAWLFCSSIFFYAYGEPKFVFVMLGSITFNFIFGLLLDRYKSKGLMALAVIFNISLLFTFKYLNFSTSIINTISGKLFNVETPVTDLSLPIGISFFTFQAISYVVDVYRGNVKAQKNPMYVGLYISFFPQLIAGPIVRYTTIEKQITGRKENTDLFAEGIERFLIGVCKKVLIANTVALVADEAFTLVNKGSLIAASYAWLGAISYSLQIYFDFSGYSDMAIGLGKMFGFEFDENFNYPYMSKSISEFWRRWHISLGTWFRDYIYFPMGGSRVNKGRLIFNLFVVWILTGIWHGAYYTFIIWGMMFFILITFEKVTCITKKLKSKFTIALYAVFTLLSVVMGWVIFRADNLGTLKRYVLSLVGGGTGYASLTAYYLKEYWIFYIAAVLLSTPAIKKIDGRFTGRALYDIVKPVVLTILFLVAVTYLTVNTYNPFIYFNF